MGVFPVLEQDSQQHLSSSSDDLSLSHRLSRLLTHSSSLFHPHLVPLSLSLAWFCFVAVTYIDSIF